jgi:signal peptidase I
VSEEYKKSGTRDTFESLVVTVILAVFGTTFVLQAFKIPTGSMEDTLLVGDHLLVNKFVFAAQDGWWSHLLPYREIRHDDIVVFRFPYPDSQSQEEPGEHLVKRVIGVPGDHIKVVNRRVFVNGRPVDEPFTNFGNPPYSPEPCDNFPPADGVPASYMTDRWQAELPSCVRDGELVVPPGQYFAMGDNRELSWDSRFWGFVPRTQIVGRPLLIYWSYETPRGEYLKNTLADRVSQTFDLVIHFFTKTRWRRLFRLVH